MFAMNPLLHKRYFVQLNQLRVEINYQITYYAR